MVSKVTMDVPMSCLSFGMSLNSATLTLKMNIRYCHHVIGKFIARINRTNSALHISIK